MTTQDTSDDDKLRVAGAVVSIFDRWCLDGTYRATLLGLEPSDPEFAAWCDGREAVSLPDREEVRRRCEMILGIYEVLTDFWSPGGVADSWMTMRNRRYGKRTPLSVACESLTGLETVYRDLRSLP